MNKQWNKYLWYIEVCVLILTMIGMFQWLISSHNSQVAQWAAENNYTVQNIDRVWLYDRDSPWWRLKGDDLCRVILVDENGQARTSFFRWRIFWMDQAWLDSGDNHDLGDSDFVGPGGRNQVPSAAR